ncbi:MAG: HD domain-containing phosphohydrolase [Pseudomonadota bacterium]
MKVLALTDGSIEAASALDAFDGKTPVDFHIPLAPLPGDMQRPDLVVMAFEDFPDFGMQPLMKWLDKHGLSSKPRLLCIPVEVARQYTASIRLFANVILPLPVDPAHMMDVTERLDTRLPRIRKQERDETAATVQRTARTFVSAFSSENADEQSIVKSLGDAAVGVCNALEKDGLGTWLSHLENYDIGTVRRSLKIAGFASTWARLLGVKGDDLKLFTKGALLHDIGKIGIPSEILEKKTPLDDSEEAIFRRHTERGKQLLEGAGETNPLLIDMAYSHHERLDGSGYPRGLEGNQINDLVRCLSIIDTYVELIDPPTSARALTPLEAMLWLEKQTETLDEKLVGAFRPVVEEHRELMKTAA